MLVDTPQQLDTPHEFFGRRMLAKEFAAERWPDATLRFLTSVEFERSRASAHAIFVVNVFDVVPTPTRIAMVKTLLRNLRRDGDATQRFDHPLSEGRLVGWHAALFPTGRSGMRKIIVGAWRNDADGPMQVVSGPVGKEKVL